MNPGYLRGIYLRLAGVVTLIVMIALAINAYVSQRTFERALAPEVAKKVVSVGASIRSLVLRAVADDRAKIDQIRRYLRHAFSKSAHRESSSKPAKSWLPELVLEAAMARLGLKPSELAHRPPARRRHALMRHLPPPIRHPKYHFPRQPPIRMRLPRAPIRMRSLIPMN